MNKSLLDLYSQYLQVSFSQASATVMSELLEGTISHDKITRFLSSQEYSSQDLWQLVKPVVRKTEKASGVLIIDDTLEEKAHMDENDLICWHYDHVNRRSLKGINMLSALYYQDQVSIPVAFELIKKTEKVIDKKTGKEKRVSAVNKNEHYRNMVRTACKNQLKFAYVLSDSWFSSAENMNTIKGELKKDFIMAIKSNRQVALSPEDKANGKYQDVEAIQIEPHENRIVYMAKVPFALSLVKQVFKNEDGSQITLYLICSDTTIDKDQTSTIYSKRWKVEEFFKSLKSNLAFNKSPAHTVRTQSNHCFAAIYGFFKMELLALKNKTNHFALKAKIYLNALKAAFRQLQRLQGNDTVLINYA